MIYWQRCRPNRALNCSVRFPRHRSEQAPGHPSNRLLIFRAQLLKDRNMIKDLLLLIGLRSEYLGFANLETLSDGADHVDPASPLARL